MTSQTFQDKIICGDNLEVMATMPDECVDLVVTSPPYNLGNAHHAGNNRHSTYEDDAPEEDYQANQIHVVAESLRLLKPDGSIFYNHKNRISKGVSITPYQWLLRTRAIIKQEIVWYNGGQNFDKCRFYPMTERLYWLSKSTSTQFRNTVNSHDLWRYTPVGAKGEHKRAFPLQMVIDILDCFPEGITVLDPYMGSGTVVMACRATNRHYIGVEREQRFVDYTNERICKEQSQLKLDLGGGK